MQERVRNYVSHVFVAAVSTQAQPFSQFRTSFALCAKYTSKSCLYTIDTSATIAFQLREKEIVTAGKKSLATGHDVVHYAVGNKVHRAE
eukprot:11507682-Heterocapsa_arctica.AAC.1